MPNRCYRILIVDDSSAVRRLLQAVISSDPHLMVAAAVTNGRLALDYLKSFKPDLMVLDIEMPEMDGLSTLAVLRKTDRHLPVIMFSSGTHRGTLATLDALALGADDYVSKERNTADHSTAMADLRRHLLPKIHALCAQRSRKKTESTPEPPLSVAAGSKRSEKKIDMVVVGVSTGGPEALFHMLPGIPQGLPVPMIIVQHMPAIFTKVLAERLSSRCSMPVQEAAGGERVTPGSIWLAPGGKHLRLTGDAEGEFLELDTSPPINFCRPSVDVLFDSVVKIHGPATLAVVLTGMGIDGLRSCEAIRQSGGQIIVQDEESSVVWGMPGAVARAGLADVVKPLPQIAAEVVRRVAQHRDSYPNAHAGQILIRSAYV